MGEVIEMRPAPVAQFSGRGRWLCLHPVTQDKVEAVVDGKRIGIWPRALAVRAAINWQMQEE